MEMIIMPRNNNWNGLTAREKAPFVLRGIVQFALPVRKGQGDLARRRCASHDA
jgi:hypothetical protein